MKRAEVPAVADQTVNGLAVNDIRSRIFTIRGVQVILDRDLAALYGVLTKNLNKAVSRNAERFPEDFMFRLTKEESLRFQIGTSKNHWNTGLNGDVGVLRFQTGTLKLGQGQHFKYQPYAFTENGIAMLSSVLRSERAIEVNIRIMREFVAMRKTLASLAPMLVRLEATERRQIADQAKNDANQERNEERFKMIMDAMRDKRFPNQKVFYDGQVYDARAFASKFILSARKSLLLIDNWVEVATLDILAKKKPGVAVEIVTSPRGNRLAASDVASFNAQYGGLTVRASASFHDRFVIVDDKSLYLFGASLKDLGKKCFAFTKLDAAEIPRLKARI